MDEKGFSLTELMVGLVIGAIVILMVGALSQVSFGSFNKLRNEANVEDDAYFALKIIQNAVRKSAAVPIIGSDANGSTLTADNKVFKKVPNGALFDLVYVDASATTHKIIFGMDGLTFAPSLSGNVVTVNLTVRKKIRGSDSQATAFSYSVRAARRNS